MEKHSYAIIPRKNVFNSAHFLIRPNDIECLHGHAYVGKLEAVAGDFEGMEEEKKRLNKFISNLLHSFNTKFLIAYNSPYAKILEKKSDVVVLLEDCVLFPIEHTSVELMSKLILSKIVEDMGAERIKTLKLSKLKFTLDEGVGQSASYTLKFKQPIEV